jgi:hypothetical protein
MSNRSSQALTEASLLRKHQIYNSRSKRGRVYLTTLYYRDHRQLSMEVKAVG